MKSLGRKPEGARLERIKASPLWNGERFRNVHPILPGLRDPNAPMPTLSDFLCGGERRVPRGPLPSMNPLDSLDQAAGQRTARHLARPLHGADRDRRPARAHRSGLGTARVAVAARRAQALPARAGSASRDAAARPRDRVARSLRPPRLSDHPRARASATCRSSPRSASARTSRPGACGPSASSSSTGGNRTSCRTPSSRVTAAPSQHFSGRGLKDRNATLWSSLVIRSQRHARVLQRRHRPHDRIRDDPRAARAVRPRDARGRRVPSGLGRHPPRAGERARRR